MLYLSIALCCFLFSHTLCPLGVAVCLLQHNRQGPPVAKDADGNLCHLLVVGSNNTNAQRRQESRMPFPFASKHGPPLYIFKTNPPLNIYTVFMYRARSRDHQRASSVLRRITELILLVLDIILAGMYTL